MKDTITVKIKNIVGGVSVEKEVSMSFDNLEIDESNLYEELTQSIKSILKGLGEYEDEETSEPEKVLVNLNGGYREVGQTEFKKFTEKLIARTYAENSKIDSNKIVYVNPQDVLKVVAEVLQIGENNFRYYIKDSK